jgi:hypothetical protein
MQNPNIIIRNLVLRKDTYFDYFYFGNITIALIHSDDCDMIYYAIFQNVLQYSEIFKNQDYSFQGFIYDNGHEVYAIGDQILDQITIEKLRANLLTKINSIFGVKK